MNYMEKKVILMYNIMLWVFLCIRGYFMVKINKRLIIVAGLILILILAAIGYIWSGRSKRTYNINRVFVIEALGTQGYGYVDVSLNPDFIEEVSKRKQSDLNPYDISFKISKSNGLSNDDVVVLSITDSAGFIFDKDKLEYRISGLADGIELDIFKELIIVYDESSKKVILDNSNCSEFVKQNVLFSIKRELLEYNRGDVVEIIGYVDMNAARDNSYNILSTTLEYIVK